MSYMTLSAGLSMWHVSLKKRLLIGLYPYYVIYDIYDAVERVSVFEALKSEPEDIKKMLRDVHKARCDKIDRRNFYAHAGFEKNITLIRIRKHGEDFLIELGYDKDCLERIYKIVGEIK
jgi:CRISPR/Cas system-associated protein Csx1